MMATTLKVALIAAALALSAQIIKKISIKVIECDRSHLL